MKTQIVDLNNENQSIRDKMVSLNTEIKDQTKTLSVLESEKMKLVKILNERDTRVFDLEAKVYQVEEDYRALKKDSASHSDTQSKLELELGRTTK